MANESGTTLALVVHNAVERAKQLDDELAGLKSERDQLHTDNDSLRHELDLLHTQLNEVRAENGALRHERDYHFTEHNEIRTTLRNVCALLVDETQRSKSSAMPKKVGRGDKHDLTNPASLTEILARAEKAQ
jgi:uncharacterized coiled-coil DUF342 family protein